MPEYRVYAIDKLGKISGTQVIAADTVEEAAERAREMADEGSPMLEIWHGAVRVMTLRPNDGSDGRGRA